MNPRARVHCHKLKVTLPIIGEIDTPGHRPRSGPLSTLWLIVVQLLSHKARISRTASGKNKNNIRTYTTLEQRKKDTQITTLALPGD